MERPIITAVSRLLLFSYTFVAAAGNTVLLRELFVSGDHQYQIAAGKHSSPVPGAPVWTVKSGLQQSAPTDQSVHIAPTEGLIRTDLLPNGYFTPSFPSKYTYLESLPSKPRDPPLA
ncbi:MAG: hypothetical protein HUU02_06940 [Bacteroidetes bacterium]|nr:hypothetical protein [Bacteroidota bacterium]